MLKNHKITFLIILVILIAGIISISLYLNRKTYLETKSIECWRDVTSVIDTYEKKHIYIGLSWHFYSPKIDACLYGGFEVLEYDKWNQSAKLVLKELYTNKIIEEENFCSGKEQCDLLINDIVGKKLKTDKFGERFQKYK